MWSVIAARPAEGPIRLYASQVRRHLFQSYPELILALVTRDPVVKMIEIEAASQDNALILGRHALGLEPSPAHTLSQYLPVRKTSREWHGGGCLRSNRPKAALKKVLPLVPPGQRPKLEVWLLHNPNMVKKALTDDPKHVVTEWLKEYRAARERNRVHRREIVSGGLIELGKR